MRARVRLGYLAVLAGSILAVVAPPGAGAQTEPAPAAGPLGEVTLFGEEGFMIQAATKTAIPLSKAPSSVSVITAQQIRESGARSIPELLRMVAGVNVRWNPMVQTIDIRSFGQNPFTSRVLLLIDGVPYNSWNKGGFPPHPGFDFFVLQNVKRVEVVRGPGSSLYGENAYWGVINIVSLSGEDLQGGRVEAYGGDLETRSLGAMYGQKVGEGSYLVSAKLLESQFPTHFWAEENDSQVDASDLFVKGGYKGFEASYYRHEDSADGFSEPVPIPGLPPGAFRSIPEIEQVVDITALKYNRVWDAAGVTFGGDVSYARRDGSHCAACHGPQQRPDFADTDVDHGNQLIGDFRLGLRMIPAHDILLGIEARRIDSGDHRHELLDPGHQGPGHEDHEVVTKYTKLAFYAQDQIALAGDRVNLTLGLRYDDESDLFDSEVSPRVAAVFTPRDGLAFRTGWSQAFRFPNFSELYQASWFFTFDASPILVIPLAVFIPNPGLQPEQIETFELGGEVRLTPELSLRADVYHSEVDDFIVMTFPTLPGGTAGVHFENHPDVATITGGEIELRWNVGRGFSGLVNFSRQEADQDGALRDSTGNLFEFVYAPENKANLSAFFGPWAGVRGTLEVQWRDERLAPAFWNEIRNQAPGPAVLEEYTLVNARLSYELPWRIRQHAAPPRFTVYGKNLLDEEAEETLTGVDGRFLGRLFYGAFEIGF